MGNFVGRNADNIGTGIAIGGLAACTIVTAGACGAAASAGLAAASGGVAFMGGMYHKQGVLRSSANGVVAAALNYVPFAGKNLKSVRWFGDNRQYKSIVTALSGGRGSVNNEAVKRLVKQVWKAGAGWIAGNKAQKGIYR